jgi:hypothetical protein
LFWFVLSVQLDSVIFPLSIFFDFWKISGVEKNGGLRIITRRKYSCCASFRRLSYLTISSDKNGCCHVGDRQTVGTRENYNNGGRVRDFHERWKSLERFQGKPSFNYHVDLYFTYGLKSEQFFEKLRSERVQLHHKISKVDSRLGSSFKGRQKSDERSAEHRRNAKICTFD